MVSSVKRSFLSLDFGGGHEISQADLSHLTFITSDDRVAEAIETVAVWYESDKKNNKLYSNHPFDLIVTPLATGSKDYIEWVKL